MPIYEFACSDCGPFDVQRPMAESSEPSDCPGCGAAAARVFSAPSGRGALHPGVRQGLEAEERSRDAPLRVSGASIGHGHGHGHSHDHSKQSGGRPWQIAH